MSVPANMVRLTWLFDLMHAGVAEDIAEFSWWMRPASNAEPQVGWDQYCGYLAQLGADGWTENADAAQFPSSVSLNRCSAAHIASDGSMLQRQDHAPADPWAGTGGSDSLPWETSFCVSLYTYTPGTFIANGRTRRGRFYLPPFQVGILDDSDRGQITTAGVIGILTHMNALYLSIRSGDAGSVDPGPGWIEDGPVLGVMSKSTTSWNHVTDLRGDTKIDSQRRRQNRQPAAVSYQEIVAYP